MSRPPSVGIIVLNWRKPADTLTCLQSLAQIDYSNFTIFVVDNGSGDDSVTLFRMHFPDVTVLETGANLGYAGGNNFGVQQALDQGAEYVCILNNDIRVSKDFLAPLVAAAQNAGRIPAITSPAICELGRPEVIWTLGANILWNDGSIVRLCSGETYSAWSQVPPFEVDYAPGSAMLIPRDVWKMTGPIDERYFLYFEEADWCVHARRNGFPVLAVPSVAVWHEVEAQQSRCSPAVTYYMTRNALRFLQRNHPNGYPVAPMLRVIALAHWYAIGDIRHGRFERAFSRIRGICDFVSSRFGPLR